MQRRDCGGRGGAGEVWVGIVRWSGVVGEIEFRLSVGMAMSETGIVPFSKKK